MPLYEYTCSNGHSYEIHQKYEASPNHRCMEAPGGIRCKARAKRAFSLPAAIYTKKFVTVHASAPSSEWHTTGQSIYDSDE